MNAIFRRRSIRKYTGEDIPDEMIRKLLEAGMCAPSARNERPWHFIIVKKTQTLERLSHTSPYAGMVKESPVTFVVCGDLKLEQSKGRWVQDCSAAIENILIEAEDLGLGAVWVGVYPDEDRMNYIRRLFNLPENIIPFSLVAAGYPAERMEYTDRYDQERVHYEKW